MSIQEKKAVFGIVSTILIMGGYVLYAFGIHGDENLKRINDPQFWGEFMLIMMGVSIVLKIIGYIIFHLYLRATHQDEDPDFVDEYDKRIEMKSGRNSNHIFILGFICSWIPLAMDKPISFMFVTLLISGVTAGILEDAWKLYYYKRGL